MRPACEVRMIPCVADPLLRKGGIATFTSDLLADFAGSNSLFRRGDARAPCDQQPIGVQATVSP